jgi:hypothetical protein
VIVRTHTGEVGLVAFKQIYHGGRFVSNIEGVEERRLLDSAAAAGKLKHVRRVSSPEAAEEALVGLGVPAEIVDNPNGHHDALEQWKTIVLGLEDNEWVVLLDGKLEVIQVNTPAAPQLPLQVAEEAKSE